MRLDRLVTVGLVRRWQRALGKHPARRTPVLMYHSVCDGSEEGVSPYYRTSTRPGVFRRHMELLRELGYRGISLEEAFGDEGTGRGREHRPCGITFDDGYADLHETVGPILEEFNFTASVFLPTAFIGPPRRRFQGHACLTWDEVRALRRVGIRFGSHTVNHPKLHGMLWPDIARELSESKAVIEERLGERVTAFAYPYAFPEVDAPFIQRLGSTLAAMGYLCAVTTRIGRVRRWDAERWQLRRLPVNDLDDAELFAAKLAGAYDWLGTPQALWKQIRRLT